MKRRQKNTNSKHTYRVGTNLGGGVESSSDSGSGSTVVMEERRRACELSRTRGLLGFISSCCSCACCACVCVCVLGTPAFVIVAACRRSRYRTFTPGRLLPLKPPSRDIRLLVRDRVESYGVRV